MELSPGQILYAANGDGFTVIDWDSDSITLRYGHTTLRRPLDYVLQQLSPRSPTAKYVSSLDGEKDEVFIHEQEHLAQTLSELESFKGFLTGMDIGMFGDMVGAHYDFDDTTKEAIMDSPYFARMDMDVSSKRADTESFSVYVGKKGVYHNDHLLVCDWRSEVGQRYYIKSEINFSYNSFDYALRLRRGLDVRGGRLWEYHDEYTDSGSGSDSEAAGRITDPFLLKVISRKRQQGQLTDIIASIQENQNSIITAPQARSMIVQGCAGSGKTMVLLHRLSYLKFNDRRLDVERIRIITPNSLFNMHINDLSRSLELDRIRRQTVDEYYCDLIGSYWMRLQDRLRLAAGRKGVAPQEKDSVSQRLRKQIKGGEGETITRQMRSHILSCADEMARRMMAELGLDTYCRIAQQNSALGRYIPAGDAGIVDAVSTAIRGLESIKAELEHYSRLGAEAAAARASAEKTLKRFEALKNDTPHWQGLMNTFSKTVLAQAKPDAFLKEEAKKLADNRRRIEERLSFPKLAPDRRREAEDALRTVTKRQGYVRFWQAAYEARRAQRMLGIEGDGSEGTLTRMGLDPEDARQLIAIRGRLAGFDIINWLTRSAEALCEKYPKLHGRAKLFAMLAIAYETAGSVIHPDLMLCIDEAQDIGPEEYRLLLDVNGGRTQLNLYGDVNQLIDRHTGTADWSELNDIAPFYRYILNEDYRNTAQIIDYCNEQFGYGMVNIGISGKPVGTVSFDEMARRLSLELVGTRRIAVISKIPYAAFVKKLGRGGVTVNQGEMVPGGISYLTPLEAKGLEFESCYVIPQGMTRAERYVACTRPLGELCIVK